MEDRGPQDGDQAESQRQEKEAEKRRKLQKQRERNAALMNGTPTIAEQPQSRDKGRSSKALSRKKRNKNPGTSDPGPSNQDGSTGQRSDSGRKRTRSSSRTVSLTSESETDRSSSREKRKRRRKRKSMRTPANSSDESGSSGEEEKGARALVSSLVKSLSARDEVMTKLVQKAIKKSDSSDSSEDDDDNRAELWSDLYQMNDNGVDIIDIKLRHRLTNPNSDPTVWWPRSKKEGAVKVTSPQRGGSLYLSHMMGDKRVNAKTIKMFHNRTSTVTVRTLLSKNAHISGEDRVGTLKKDNKLKLSKDWKEASSCHEVMGSLINHVALTHQIRPYSYEAIAVLQAVHEVRAFYGVTETPKKQKELLEKALDYVWRANKTRSQAHREPLQYTEVMEHMRMAAMENQHLMIPGALQMGLQSGDCYSGTKSESTNNLQKLNDSIKKLQSNAGRQGNLDTRRPGGVRHDSSGSARDKRPRTESRTGKQSVEEKLASTCQNYNSRRGCNDRHCKLRHKCSKKVTIHGSKGDFEGVCWGDHKKSTCPK